MSYAAILEAARNQDEAALALALKYPTRISIDIRGPLPFLLTPAAQLARENNVAAVEFLKKHRASEIDIKHGYVLGDKHYPMQVEPSQKYYDSLAMAHALIGNVSEAEAYRAQHNADKNYIAYAYALVNNFEQVELYRIQHEVSVDEIVVGFALAGNFEQVEIYRTKHKASVDKIAHCFAVAGYHELVELYRTRHHASVDEIAYGYAFAGNHEMVEKYRTDHDAFIDSIAFGYAYGGYIEHVERYLCKGADIGVIVEALKDGDFIAEAERFTEYEKVLKLIPRKSIPQQVLYEYAASCLLNPVKILDDHEYKEHHVCQLYFTPSNIPVMWHGFGPYDLAELLKNRPNHPFMREIEFDVDHLQPARTIREKLKKVVDEHAKAADEIVSPPPAKKRRVTVQYDAESGNNNNNNNNRYNLRKRGATG